MTSIQAQLGLVLKTTSRSSFAYENRGRSAAVLKVHEVKKGGLADFSGKIKAGDEIISVNGGPISSFGIFSPLGDHPRDRIAIRIVRGLEQLDIVLDPAERDPIGVRL